MIFLKIIASIISIILIVRWVVRFMRKLEFSDWEIGDSIQDIRGNVRTLSAWSRKFLVYSDNDGSYLLEWGDFISNLSAERRRRYEICKKDMKINPGFQPRKNINKVGTNLNRPTTNYNSGKDISLWSEIECQTYLKLALESEDYEFAEKIKKQMEKYR